MTIRKVQKGERLAIRASDWNEIASHVNGSQGTPSAHQGEARRFVYVINRDEERDMLRGMTVKITGTITQQGKEEGDLPDDYIFNAEFPEGGESFIPAVMETDAEAAGGVGRAVVSGIAAARISSGSGLFGTPDGKLQLEGDSYKDVFDKILTGLADVDAALADLDVRYNKALDEAVANGTLKIEDYIVENMDDIVKMD